ncbi:5'-nucleotidase C-terminal domain-containing protein [Winogradskyella aurantiaca]|uniref:5'-nucleotidase C-terminal domain-containing protein n=1 Tax=Winogradskyella aurantiaca TaxID=2219558 RepID=UPI000E1D0A10|nr:5'-nucleotidase [Winogradskyella aurantiaca]
MKNVIIPIILVLICISSCKEKDLKISKINSERIEINNSLTHNSEIETFIAPYRKHVDSSLSSVLCFSPEVYTKKDGHLNTAIGNMMADAVMLKSQKIFEHRSGEQIDFVLLNHGGIRSVLPEGDITSRTAYEIMPFENEVVVVSLKGTQVEKLINYLSMAKRAHPVSKEFQLTLNKDNEVISATVNGAPIQPENSYNIATSDYLINGGDNMSFFQSNEKVVVLDYKIRNVLIDYFTDIDTIRIGIDNRFKQLNN